MGRDLDDFCVTKSYSAVTPIFRMKIQHQDILPHLPTDHGLHPVSILLFVSSEWTSPRCLVSTWGYWVSVVSYLTLGVAAFFVVAETNDCHQLSITRNNSF